MTRPNPGIVARAVVDRVIDGDTINVHVTWPMTIRLKDCWSPETRGDERLQGLAAKEHLQTIVSPGDSVIVQVDSQHANDLGDLLTFGRVVGSVWPSNLDQSLSELMVGAGFATEEKQ